MNDNILKKGFFSKIVRPREKMINFDEKLKESIKNRSIGTKSRESLLKDIELESSGQFNFGTFDTPPIIERGEIDLVYDVDGKEYIDCISGFGASTIGQCHPEVVKTIAEQSKKLIHNFDFPTPPRIELAQKLCNITPGNFEKKLDSRSLEPMLLKMQFMLQGGTREDSIFSVLLVHFMAPRMAQCSLLRMEG